MTELKFPPTPYPQDGWITIPDPAGQQSCSAPWPSGQVTGTADFGSGQTIHPSETMTQPPTGAKRGEFITIHESEWKTVQDQLSWLEVLDAAAGVSWSGYEKTWQIWQAGRWAVWYEALEAYATTNKLPLADTADLYKEAFLEGQSPEEAWSNVASAVAAA